MPSLFETAYPRLKHNPSRRDLAEIYTPTLEEFALAEAVTKEGATRLGFLVTLKTFQRLGYFVPVQEVPVAIVEHLARCSGYLFVPVNFIAYDHSRVRKVHLETIRTKLGIRPYPAGGAEIVERAMVEAARTREDLRDLINVALEELTRHRFELPAFSTLVRTARRIRKEVNSTLYRRVADALSLEEQAKLDALFAEPGFEAATTAWHTAKRDPGGATLSNLKTHIAHYTWLLERKPDIDVSGIIPQAKLERFAAEADSLDAYHVQRLEPAKRTAFVVALLHVKTAKALDDLGDLFCRRVAAIRNKARKALEAHKLAHQDRADELVRTLKEVVSAYQGEGTALERFGGIETVIGHRAETLINECEAHEVYADNNYRPFVWGCYSSDRATLFRLVRALPLKATTQDHSFMPVLAFLLEHEGTRGEWLPLQEPLDLAWVDERWWPLVTGEKRRTLRPRRLHRKHFEACAFNELFRELKSGDVCIEGSLEYADYRAQLISDEELAAGLPEFGEQVGLPLEPQAFITYMKAWLTEQALTTDLTFPENSALTIIDGEPHLKQRRRRVSKRRARYWDKKIDERMQPLTVPDSLADAENLLHLTQFFGLLSGFEPKMEDPRARYLQTLFCYGCNIGPSQTAKSMKGTDRKQLAWVNRRHISEDTLEEAKNHVINAYNRFALPKLWGTGKTASADGTKWDVYEKNLLAEFHIRYGGYGGIGYYHTSDTYIALFSRFIPCGVYEATYILDGPLENDSDIQPDTLYSDTHGQSVPLFGLSFLLGITLMPRIRNWKHLHFVRPDKGLTYRHIDELFKGAPDWDLIRRHLPDMLRIVLSIKAGRISASTILKRLSTYSRKNVVYQAFYELGKVVRTGFLLRYIADPELRDTIQAAMNKSEQFNSFLKWMAFGGEEIRTNDRDLQQKIIKYQHLVANCQIFHTVMQLTRVVKELREEGFEVPEEVLATMNPYRTEHISRLGEYRLDLSRVPPEPHYDFTFAEPEEGGKALHENRPS